MPLIKLLPKSSSEIYGIIGVNYSNIKYTVECNTDVNYCKYLFLHTQSTNTFWGIKNKNDWVKITFNKDLLYMTHYSLQSSSKTFKAKGVLVEGIKENGMSEIIDNNCETGLTGTFQVSTKEIKKPGPYKSLKFSIFDSYATETTHFSSLFGIDVFGILIPKIRYTCNQKQKRRVIPNGLLFYILLV